MWVHIPAFGKALQAAGKPQYMAVLMFLTGIMTTRKSLNKRSKTAKGGGRSAKGGTSAPGGVSLDQWLAIALLALLLSVVLAIIAFRSSSERTRLANITYDQNGAFSYSADVPAGVYDGTKLTTG